MRRRTTLLVVSVCLAVPATAALAVAPPDRVVSFSTLRRGWLPGIPRDVRSGSRILTLSSGRRVALAPTRNGNFCEAFSRPLSFGGCRARPGFQGKSLPMLGLTTTYRNRQLTAVAGDVVASSDHALYLLHRDGSERRLPLVYVTSPIDAGFFSTSIVAQREQGGKAPVRFELRVGSSVVESDAIPAPPRPPR